MNFKKGISSVVSISLILLITISAITVFNGWHNQFASDIMADTESKNSGFSNIVDVDSSTIYFRNDGSSNITINSVQIGNVNCNYSGSLGLGMQKIDISSCASYVNSSTAKVVLKTNIGIYDSVVHLYNNINN